ncbi:hypothetical protein J6590_094904 [Homalodisca vitripennis]|nr:hypothetical protein J6590_062402 [Homalodisca vitripennis]KAG8329096.1 hypothetical protein J6590_094904 [Homalodisca vitripennis]
MPLPLLTITKSGQQLATSSGKSTLVINSWNGCCPDATPPDVSGSQTAGFSPGAESPSGEAEEDRVVDWSVTLLSRVETIQKLEMVFSLLSHVCSRDAPKAPLAILAAQIIDGPTRDP